MKVAKVQWFHPDGEKMPNGVYFQRGGWLAECEENTRHFAAADGVGVPVAGVAGGWGGAGEAGGLREGGLRGNERGEGGGVSDAGRTWKVGLPRPEAVE